MAIKKFEPKTPLPSSHLNEVVDAVNKMEASMQDVTEEEVKDAWNEVFGSDSPVP